MKTLAALSHRDYLGLSYQQANDRAMEVCQIAATTGQTSLAYQHLGMLLRVMQQALLKEQA